MLLYNKRIGNSESEGSAGSEANLVSQDTNPFMFEYCPSRWLIIHSMRHAMAPKSVHDFQKKSVFILHCFRDPSKKETSNTARWWNELHLPTRRVVFSSCDATICWAACEVTCPSELCIQLLDLWPRQSVPGLFAVWRQGHMYSWIRRLMYTYVVAERSHRVCKLAVANSNFIYI